MYGSQARDSAAASCGILGCVINRAGRGDVGFLRDHDAFAGCAAIPVASNPHRHSAFLEPERDDER